MLLLGQQQQQQQQQQQEQQQQMAQPFVSHLPLIEGHGNFGSVDGDPAAAMRYTECRLSSFCQEVLLKDLNTAACNFKPNFDATEVEPECLPARLPLLLIQGTTGVAVGLSTNLPPHNLSEVISACIALIEEVIEEWIKWRYKAMHARAEEEQQQLQQQQQLLHATITAAKYPKEIADLLQRSKDAAEATRLLQGI
ncbi:DNA gyrase subunit A, putative [Eimeria maxima]|uniref:DNA gyrase subunit A, putative n=1 Tax=Eimeria maxima TaxID=5804 RepID=U6MD23_EIMMA|nr:DNA gyrase subunit A, putative [Eimeria maxima]CDJ60973.1 DNA gyrase subunit A, putative [Eimeria maxima]